MNVVLLCGAVERYNISWTIQVGLLEDVLSALVLVLNVFVVDLGLLTLWFSGSVAYRSNLNHRGVIVSDLLMSAFFAPLLRKLSRIVLQLQIGFRNTAGSFGHLVESMRTPLGSYADWLNWFNSIRLSSKVKDLLEGVLYITWWSFGSKAGKFLVVGDADGEVGLKPYDPIKNYLSPRPKFLRYNPNRRRKILKENDEGVAHDSRILSEAIRNQNAPFLLPPPDKYYLCDAAYAHTRGFMAPYRNVRYWLGDFERRRPLNGKEKFNHSHAKLRNMIKRAYGVLKAHFLILKRMIPFSRTTQRNITIACFALHNFICKEGLDDELFSTYDQSNVQLDNENVLVEDDGGIEEDEVVQPQGNASDRQYMTNLRDQIMTQLMQSG
ncbi:putative harbinger transposase-derived nuclease domain-containing protein [Tanacetum coccineum]